MAPVQPRQWSYDGGYTYRWIIQIGHRAYATWAPTAQAAEAKAHARPEADAVSGRIRVRAATDSDHTL